MPIHTTVGLAVEDANRMARLLSLKRPRENIMALVSRDTGPGKVFLSWSTIEQNLATADILCGLWLNGRKIKV